mgnify:CR=1 FL=1
MSTRVTLAPRYVRLAQKIAEERNQSFEESRAWDNQSDS